MLLCYTCTLPIFSITQKKIKSNRVSRPYEVMYGRLSGSYQQLVHCSVVLNPRRVFIGWSHPREGRGCASLVLLWTNQSDSENLVQIRSMSLPPPTARWLHGLSSSPAHPAMSLPEVPVIPQKANCNATKTSHGSEAFIQTLLADELAKLV